jgi:hypothetical protein
MLPRREPLGAAEAVHRVVACMRNGPLSLYNRLVD